ncbi:MAG: alpha/beta hydrolase [Candidatus Xenobia bacterium]
MTYSWGHPRAPRVYVLHGWGGRASQMRSIIAALCEAGWQVVALDGPAHGASQGRRTSLLDFARALRAVVEAHGPAHALVTHSMGGASATRAIHQGLPVERLVLISPPSDPGRFTEFFARQAGLSAATLQAFREQVQERTGVRFADLSIPVIARGMRVPLLIVHDEHDPEVPVERAWSIAEHWPGAELTLTRGLGHRRILHDRTVLERIVRFLGRRRDADAALETYLFDPEKRRRPA